MTHRKKVARVLAGMVDVGYQQALAAVVAAAEAGALSSEGGGPDDDLEGAARRASLWLPGSQVQFCPTGGASVFPDPLVLAQTASGGSLVLSTSDVAQHVLVCGRTGSGKSVTARRLVEAMVSWGWDGVIIDPNGEAGSWIGDLAGSRGVPLRSLRPSPIRAQDTEGSRGAGERLDVLAGLTAQEVAEVLTGAATSWDPYRRQVGAGLVRQVWELLERAHGVDPSRFRPASTESLLGLLAAGSLVEATNQRCAALGEPAVNGEGAFTAEAEAIAPQLAELLRSVWAQGRGQLECAGHAVDAEAAGCGGVVSWVMGGAPGITHVAGVSSRREQQVVLGALLAQCRKAVPSRCAAGGAVGSSESVVRRFVVVESAEVMPVQALVGLLARARACGVAVVLVSQQSPRLWLDVAVPLADAVQANVGVVVAHRAGTPHDAAALSTLLGAGDLRAAVLQELGAGEVLVGGPVFAARSTEAMVGPGRVVTAPRPGPARLLE